MHIKLWLYCSIFTLLSTPCYSEKTWVVGAVPQQSASKLTKLWKPFLQYISQKIGEKFQFQAAPNFKIFEQRSKAAVYDFVYFSPSHYTTYHKITNYNAIAKAKNKKIRGIIVVRKDSSMKKLSELDKLKMGFPSPTSFAASVIPRGYLSSKKISFSPIYSKTHDNVYYGVANNIYPAGGGVIRTFNATDPKIKAQLRVLWTSKGYTPHAIAAHQRVPAAVIEKFQNALVLMSKDPKVKHLYQKMKIKFGFEPAKNADWDDVRSLGIKIYN